MKRMSLNLCRSKVCYAFAGDWELLVPASAQALSQLQAPEPLHTF